MSKMDDMQAMREARYAERNRPGGPTRPTTPARRTPTTTPVATEPAATGGASDITVCGHRNMGGRTCTRDKGHGATSHRYS